MAQVSRKILQRFCIPLGLTLIIASWPDLSAQNKSAKKENASQNQASYRVSVNVVMLNATVTDKDGNLAKDLTADDFRVYDDGKLQSIQTFAMESFDSETLGEPEASSVQSKNAESRQSNLRPQTRPRMISIVIDDLTMELPLPFLEIINAVKEFINKEMNPGDQVAILSGSRKVQLPFSDHKQYLLEKLPSVLEKLNRDTTERPCGLDLTDLEAQAIAQDPTALGVSAYNVQLTAVCEAAGISLPTAALRQNGDSEFRTYSLLQTIRQHIRALRHFKGSKIVVLFTDGFVAQRKTPAAYKLQEVIDLAMRSGIILNAVGTRGVAVYMDAMFKPPGLNEDDEEKAEAARRMPGASWKALSRDNTWKILVREDDKRGQESPLIQMASDTGGMFHGGNFMDEGFLSIARREISYYIMTYIMPPQKTEGAYHNIRLEVTRPGLQLSYRKGYYTAKEELSFETRKKEDIIAALAAPGNMNEIPMTLSYNYFQEDDTTYAVSFIGNVRIRGLQFYEEDSRRKNLINLIVAAYDENDRFISGVEKAIDFRLLEESYAGLNDHGITSSVELKLPIGRYKIKAVVRENNQGKMGSATKSVEIP